MDAYAPLGGRSVLVLEDDYYQARDAQKTLEIAGASIVGPFGDAADAVARTDQKKPDCAVLDLNLGRGINFAPARALLARGVPVVFVTGYDHQVIPQDLANVPCIQKPYRGQDVVEAIRQTLTS